MNDYFQIIGGTAMLLAVVKWLMTDRGGLLKALQVASEARISALEARANACETSRAAMQVQWNTDREVLLNQLTGLQAEFRDYLKTKTASGTHGGTMGNTA